MKYIKIMFLFTLAIMLFPLSGQAQQVELEEISPIRAKLMVRNGSLLVDVREKDEVSALAYDVENMINIPLSELENRMTEIPKDKHLVLACRSGKRSLRATNILIENGYTNLVNLDGGILAWQEKNLEVVTNGVTAKKACCANPNSKDCNPDGTCKKASKNATKACCASAKKEGKACCSKKQSN